MSFSALAELERRERVVLMVGQRVGHRALVAVEGREVKDEVEVVGQAGEHLVVVDRRLDQADAIVGGDVLALGREQVVDHEDVAHVVREQRAHEVRADEAGAADDQDAARR